MMLVRIYLRSIRLPLPDRIWRVVQPDRLARAGRFLREEDRLRCLAAGLLLSDILDVHSDSDTELNIYGKPLLKLGLPFFSLSHSGEYAALAVADVPVGVDIELIQPFDISSAKSCFTENEYGWLAKQHNDEAFYRLWTAKEAVLKADGTGFAADPARFDVLEAKSGQQCIINGEPVLFYRNEIQGHALCAAARTGGRAAEFELSIQS